MQLRKTIDPRDNDWMLKTRKRELIEIARAQGITDIAESLPADDYTEPGGKMMPGIRTLLRQRGVKRVATPNRPLGRAGRHETLPMQPKQAAAAPTAAPADPEWAEFQAWKASQQKAPPPPAAPPKPKRLVERPVQEINALRDYCKANSIKMDRRDNKATLKAKVEAHKAQNGEQDAPQLLQ